MNDKLFFRILTGLVILASILNGWWFVALPLGIIGAWFFSNYFELIIAGLIYDSLFGMVAGQGWKGYAGIIISIICFVAIKYSKKAFR